MAQLATETSDGPAGVFYNSTTPENFAPMMSDDEYASFKAAFDSKTLTIQSAATAPGVTMTGEYDTTFMSSGSGKGMSISGDAVVDNRNLNSKYALISYDSLFGPTVISWGGPKNVTAMA